MSGFTNGTPNYENVLGAQMQFAIALKTLPTKGNLVYEYNPFRNYRVESTHFTYKNRLYSPKELLQELGVTTISGINIEDATQEQCIQYIDTTGDWKTIGVPQTETDPVLVESGELTDFETDQLTFSLSNPVNILPQYSYDNSVNLILNDGKNKPRLINSRFSATEKNQYQIVDRKGNNDTNIYDQGSQFDLDTSLYKQVIEIPKLRLVSINVGGNLQIGNYHFYFRYADADGNETDFVAESGLVSLFVGEEPCSIKSGFRNENSYKLVRFLISNIDSAYQYVNVYYTRATSDIYQHSVVTAYKIEQKYLVTNSLTADITITGNESIIEIPISDINPYYQIMQSARAQTACQNMLFLGNVKKVEIPYKELQDISLRFCPYIAKEAYPLKINYDYTISSYSKGYYDPQFIYNKVGYWNHEFYRLGIVYLLSDGTLSQVFNIRGLNSISWDGTNGISPYSQIPFYTNTGDRNYITYEEDTYRILYSSDSGEQQYGAELENALGVISLNADVSNEQEIFSINFKIDPEAITYLKENLKIRGFFFVRQKRIPTILCQAYTIGLDNQSRTPVLPISNTDYVAERFLDDNQILNQDFDSRLYRFASDSYVTPKAAICPEYDINTAYLNNLFSGNEFTVQESDLQPSNKYLTQSRRNFHTEDSYTNQDTNTYTARILGIEDDMKLGAIGDVTFSARAGEAEEGFRYEYLERENSITNATNLIRGSFGPYLGITGYNYQGRLIDIKIPGFSSLTSTDLFKIRYSDKSAYFAISERIDLNNMYEWFDMSNVDNPDSSDNDGTITLLDNIYRGDCYICQFTHRLNRNFQDPSAPINDKIVDRNCWKDHYSVEDGVVKTENFDEINLGDLNAIRLGMWVTITVRSTYNLNVRALDESIPDETALTGHPRGFYPYFPIAGEGAYKTPEALCVNDGFQKSLSERYNYEVPDVPAIKNDFTNRISYSDININDAFKNGFRVFQGTHYRDYPKTYGSIIKLVELFGNILCIFEHGVALIPVNERAVAGEGSGGNVYINTSNVLPENPKMLSDTFGTQWPESVVKTPYYVYGVDTIGKKIWRTNGTQFEVISDFKIQEFLNQNISLTEKELDPVIGIRNVKSHYNAFKQDVMFTFYDNLHGFEEKVWSICFNEILQKWITFYSWVPSYSENIDNIYFSFDRNTSKWIAKLGVSHSENDFSDGATLDNNIIPNNAKAGDEVGVFSLSNRNLPTGNDVEAKVYFTLERDNFQNYKKFEIKYKPYTIVDGGKVYGDPEELQTLLNEDKQFDSFLYLKNDASDLLSEMYVRDDGNGNKIYPGDPGYNLELSVYKDARGRREWLDKDQQLNSTNIVSLLNIRANIQVTTQNTDPNIKDYVQGWTNNTTIDGGFYESVVAVIPKYNLQFLTTDFWKHGQAGIIDIADKIYPTYWYGKQHPFEFEVVVVDNPSTHKLFDNLQIISNKAVPESFHYEIVGECFDFAKDKVNMFVRQEVTKDFYQYNGSDILYNDKLFEVESKQNKKSVTLPLYYSRVDSFNEVEDYYKQKTTPNKSYDHLSGSEVVYYENLNEFRIWQHSKAVDIEQGRLRGNMNYQEDRWNVQINPIVIVEKNEQYWNSVDEYGNPVKPKVPITIGNSPIPKDFIGNQITIDNIPEDLRNNLGYTLNDIDLSNWGVYAVSRDQSGNIIYADANTRREVKIKDKFVKIRVRYSGEDLAIITALKTLYSISYA